MREKVADKLACVDLRSKSGEGLRFIERARASPGLHRTMLRIAESNPTSPRRGEVNRNRAKPIQPNLIPL